VTQENFKRNFLCGKFLKRIFPHSKGKTFEVLRREIKHETTYEVPDEKLRGGVENYIQ